MPRRLLWWSIGSAAVLCVAAGWFVLGLPPFGSSRQSQKTQPKPLEIQAAEVRRIALPIESDYTGVVVSPLNTELRARVTGYVIERNFKLGESVKAGDVLFRIDPRPFVVALAQATGRRKEAQASVEFYQAQVDRYKPLARKGFASQERFQTAQRNRDQAEGQVAIAAAQIARQELNLKYANVRAPYDGRTGITNVNVGDLVMADQSNLVRLIQLNPIRIQVALSQPDAQAVQAALASGGTPELEIVDPDGKIEHRTARIREVDNQFDVTTARLLVRAVVDNADFRLVPGEFLHVRLTTGTQHELVVPSRALFTQLDQHLVYLIKGGTAHMQQVEVGGEHGQDTVVTKGLSSGDIVATDHIQHLNDGEPVRLEDRKLAGTGGKRADL